MEEWMGAVVVAADRSWEAELVGCAKAFKLLKEKERNTTVAPPWCRVSRRKVRRDFQNPYL